MAVDRGVRRLLPGVACVAIALGLLSACRNEVAPVGPDDDPRPPVEARASVDRAAATTGDVITYTVTVDHDSAYEIDIPEAGAEIAGFRIIDVGREDDREVDGRSIVERWYRLRADLVGSYVLPPVRVTYRLATDSSGEDGASEETIETSEIFVEVESVLPDDGEATDIRDIKPLRHPASRIPWVWIAVGTGVVLIIVVIVVLLRRRSQIVPPPPPPHEIAFAALDALRATEWTDPEAVRRFYFAISHTLREYVEGRWELNATDLTSEEIIANLDTISDLEVSQVDQLQTFLVDTDQVKFAKHVPVQEEIEGTYERALSFVESTRAAAPSDPAAVNP